MSPMKTHRGHLAREFGAESLACVEAGSEQEVHALPRLTLFHQLSENIMKSANALLLAAPLIFLLSSCAVSVKITSDPSEAFVFAKKDSLMYLQGMTPMVYRWNTVFGDDTLYLQVKKAGYRDSKIVPISKQQHNLNCHFSLKPIGDSSAIASKPRDAGSSITETPSAYLKLTASEPFVDVYIDNELRGQIPKDEAFVKKLAVGQYQITARKEFFRPVTIRPKLFENDVFSYNFQLQRVAGWNEEPPGESNIVQARGNLTVGTEQSNFKVIFEGQTKIPPFQLRDIPAGVYQLIVVREGVKKTITAIVNDKETCLVDLDKEFLKK